jgi:hypothetical protein
MRCRSMDRIGEEGERADNFSIIILVRLFFCSRHAKPYHAEKLP